jgi:hypothetical protein
LTEPEVLPGGNLLLIGHELVQFVTATSLGSGRWRIARLLRGRYGTERLMTGHRALEPGFVIERTLLSRAGGLDSRSLERWYKAVALGFDAGGVIPERFTNSSGALQSWAPCQVQADRSVAGQITVSWQRRTRFGGEWDVTSAAEAPLNETVERYEVDLKDPASYASYYLIGAPTAAAVRGTRVVTDDRNLALTDAELQAIYPDGLWVAPSTLVNGTFALGTTGWTAESGTLIVRTFPYGGIGASPPGFPEHGLDGSGTAVASQVVDLPPELDLAAGDPVRLAGWLASTQSSGTPTQVTTLALQALDAGGAVLASVDTAFTPVALNTWYNVVTSALVLPDGTARLAIKVTYGAGTPNTVVALPRLNGPRKASQELALELFQVSAQVGRGWGRPAIV